MIEIAAREGDNAIRKTYDLPMSLINSNLFTILRDENGDPYNDLPCMLTPEYWDEDALWSERKYAARVCVSGCPALGRCRDRADELGVLANGVWGGKVYRSRPKRGARPGDDLALYDATLASWAREAGVFHPEGAA